MIKPIIVIGHNQYQQGANLYNKDSEYTFNLKVAKYMLETHNIPYATKLHGPHDYTCKEVAERVAGQNFDTVLELHINAFNGKSVIRGSEILIANADSIPLASCFTANLKHEYGISNRRIHKVGHRDRGYRNLKNYIEAGVKRAAILEPCFGDTLNDESEAILEDVNRYGDLLARVLKELE